MQRMTITLDDPLVVEFEDYLKAHGYGNRSEAVRDLIRARLEAEHLAREPEGECLGNLSYVYNHHERELAARLTRAQHHHHDLAISTLHIHLDHDNCLETVVLRGPVARVRAFADAVITQPGVRHGTLSILPVRIREQAHEHGDDGGGHPHLHFEPLP
jgi:CopG family nickel-responsive transcriptional regulator